MGMKKKNIIITEQQLNSLILGDLFKNMTSQQNQEKALDFIKWQIPGFPSDIDSEDLKIMRKLPNNNTRGKSASARTLPNSSSSPSKTTSAAAPGQSEFQDAINKIIDGLEGGYYHPDMKKRNPSKFSAMGKSGETMFGMDRRHGNQEKYAAGQEFWRLIDSQNASANWSYNYKLQDNPQLAGQLKNLIGDIMKPLFDNYANKYLTPEAKNIVLGNPPLYFNFVYATWNGPNWFKKFAKKINDSVSQGVTDPNALADLAVQSRRDSGNSILSKTSSKVDNIMSTMA